MTTEHQVMRFLERADPVRSGDPVAPAISARRYLETRVKQRSTAMPVLERTDQTTESSRPRWPMYGAAAAVLAIVIGVVALLSRGDGESVPVTTVEPTVAAPETVPSADPVEGAQSAIVDLLATYNTGDTDAVLDLLSDDVIMTQTYDGGRPSPDDGDAEARDMVELRFAWNNAQGEQWTEPTCALADEQRPAGTTLECTWDTLDAPVLAVDGVPIPTRALVVVDDGAVAELHLGYSNPDFATLGKLLNAWLETNHPVDAALALDWPGETREDATARGEARAEWSEQWAAWRDAYGCTGTIACTLGPEAWVAEYDSICTAAAGSLLSAGAVDQVQALPPLARTARRLLVDADEDLLATGLDEGQVAELQQTRLDAMIELGIDEACHPDLG